MRRMIGNSILRRSFMSVVLLVLTISFALVLSPDAIAQETQESTSSMNGLQWLFQVSGLIGIFLLALSMYLVALLVKGFVEIRMSVAGPKEVIATVEKLIAERNVKDIVDVLKGEQSYYGQILLAGIADLRFGLEDAKERLERKAEALTGVMERGISSLAVLGTLGPMIGLLGTLKGMIKSFGAIATSGVGLDAQKVAEGISEALVLTFEGVFLAIPAIFFFSFFRNSISRIQLELGMLADEHLRSIARLLKVKASAPNE